VQCTQPRKAKKLSSLSNLESFHYHTHIHLIYLSLSGWAPCRGSQSGTQYVCGRVGRGEPQGSPTVGGTGSRKQTCLMGLVEESSSWAEKSEAGHDGRDVITLSWVSLLSGYQSNEIRFRHSTVFSSNVMKGLPKLVCDVVLSSNGLVLP
jgi:hypothetical protein